MAGEVLVLTTDKLPDDVEVYNVIFFYQINPVVQVNGITVAPTPSSQLPTIVELLQLMSQPQKELLDLGNLAFEVVSIARHKGENLAAMMAKLQKQWEAREQQFIDNFRAQYQRTGQVVDF